MPNAFSWAAVPLQPHSYPRIGASSLLLLWFCDSRVDLSPSLVASLALPIENVILFLASAKRNKSRFLPTARRAKIRIVPAPIACGSNKAPNIGLIQRGYLADKAPPFGWWHKQHSQRSACAVMTAEGAWIGSPCLLNSRGDQGLSAQHAISTCSFSHSRLQAFQPRTHQDRHPGCQPLTRICETCQSHQDVTRRAATDPLIYSLNEFVYCPSLRRLGHERQQIYLIPVALAKPLHGPCWLRLNT